MSGHTENWLPVDDDAARWDARIGALAGGNFYQSYRWGEVKQRLGWRVLRVAMDQSAAQVLWRRYPFGVVLAWIPGGPAGAASCWSAGLPAAVRRLTGARMLYLRINALQSRSDPDCASAPADAEVLTPGAPNPSNSPNPPNCPNAPNAPHTPNLPDRLRAHGWRVPAARLGSGLSLRYGLQRPPAERLTGLSRDWRSNLKRAAKHGLCIARWEQPDAATAMALFRDLEKIKGIGTQVTGAELAAYSQLLGERLIWMRCDDAAGAPIALRLAARYGDTVWEMLAAATVEARKVSASHAVLWAMLDYCAAQGARHYDLGGIDPAGNKGVFDFKQGLGAPVLEYVGEWEWASNPLLRYVANAAIGRRGGHL